MSAQSTSDFDLVQMIVATGSDDAFRELFQRHSPRLYRVALRLVGSPHDAEDALQDTWLRAIRRLHRFRWESSLSTWLTGIAANVCRELLQRQRRWERNADVAHAQPIAPADASMIDVERAVAMLPPGERAAFILHDVEGFTHEQIAAQMNWTSGTSKSQLHRARKSLALRLSQTNAGGS